jgi:signal transduction histidine kinase
MKKSIANKIVLYIIGFSSILAIIITAFQIYLDFSKNLDDLNRELININTSFVPPLSSSLWYLDQIQLSKQLEGISKLPDIASVKLISNDVGSKTLHTKLSNNGPTKTFSLQYSGRILGSLVVETSMDEIYSKLMMKFFIIFMSNAFKTLLVAFFSIYIIRKFVTNRLQEISLESKRMTFEQQTLLNHSQLKSFDMHDELDEVSTAIQEMQNNFYNSYLEMKETKEKFNDIISFQFNIVFETNSDLTFIFSHSNNESPFLNKLFQLGESLENLPLNNNDMSNISNRPNYFEANFTHQDKIFLIQARSAFHGNVFLGFRGVVVDVSKELHAKKQIKEQNELLIHMQKLDALGEMTAGITHDFNNILTVIEGSLRLFKMKANIDEDTIHHISNAETATAKGISTIKRLMLFARTSESKTMRFEANQIIANLTDMFSVLTSSKAIVIKINLSKDDCFIFADPTQFENMMINLVVNARDAMVIGGNLMIQTQISHRNKILTISVKDNGHGIPDAIKLKIFNPFFTTKEDDKGTGLGLSMAYGFVQQAQGKIEVESEVNVGTTFKIHIPISE